VLFCIIFFSQPIPGKLFPSRDYTNAWHSYKALIFNDLFFGIWLEITIPTTQSAKRRKDQERKNEDDNEG
jgi:hypothetical protein